MYPDIEPKIFPRLKSLDESLNTLNSRRSKRKPYNDDGIKSDYDTTDTSDYSESFSESDDDDISQSSDDVQMNETNRNLSTLTSEQILYHKIKPYEIYEPKIFGFRINNQAVNYPKYSWLRWREGIPFPKRITTNNPAST
jgi:hypothetical protein